MQNTREKMPVYLISLPVIASCVLRFFQLLKFTDKSTGLITANNRLSLIVYALLLLIIVAAAIYSRKKTELSTLLDFEASGKSEHRASIILAVSFFLDFIHQSYNFYNYLTTDGYIEYDYLVLFAISGFTAVLCCFYFVCFSLTAKGSNYDFRNFTLLHFVPMLWCFSKLIMIMLKIIDIKLGIEAVLEFLLLSAMIMFFFCYISMVDNNGRASRLFVFFAMMTFILSVIIVLPRFAVVIIGRASVLSKIEYSLVSYIAVGIFAVTLSGKASKTD